MKPVLRCWVLVSIFLMFFLPYSLAVCEYVDFEKYIEFGQALCLQSSNTFYAEALVFSDFINGSRPSFTVSNPNSFQVKAFFNYTIQGHLNKEQFFGITINGRDKQVIQDLCYAEDAIGNCSISLNSTQYFITQPRKLDPCNTDIPKIRTIVNKPCENNADCPTLCNIAGFCGKDRVPPCCPEGKMNCNNVLCSFPSSKKGGYAYICEWECMSGVGVGGVCKGKDGESCQKGADCLSGVCNIIDQCGPVVCSNGTKQCDELGCFIPSTRKYGEAYKCSWECKSGFGTNGICKRSFGELCVIIIILIFVLGVGIFFAWLAFKRFKTKKAEQEAGEIKIGIIRGAREEGKKIREDIVREAEEEFKNTKVKINKINLELKSKKNELAVLEEEKGSLVSKREDIQQLRLQISKLSNRLKRDNEDLAIHKKQWNEERIKPYKNPQGYEVIINEEGYEVFANNHNRLFHIWWYRKNRGAITPGYQIHHKDFNKRNNDVDNLVEVTPGQHEKLHKDQKY